MSHDWNKGYDVGYGFGVTVALLLWSDKAWWFAILAGAFCFAVCSLTTVLLDRRALNKAGAP